MLAEFIKNSQSTAIEIHFNGKKYHTDIFAVEKMKDSPLLEVSEKVHFTMPTKDLADDIFDYRASNKSFYPIIDIIITNGSQHMFLKEATLTEWADLHFTALVDTIKIFTDDIYELASSSQIQKNLLKSKLMNDSTFNRFYNIIFEE